MSAHRTLLHVSRFPLRSPRASRSGRGVDGEELSLDCVASGLGESTIDGSSASGHRKPLPKDRALPTWDDDEEPTQPYLPAGKAARVLVAEDDEWLRSLVVMRLLADGYDVEEAQSGPQLVDALELAMRDEPDPTRAFDLLIVDQQMPGLSGTDALRRARCTTPAIVMTAFPTDELRREARSLGAPVLAKPFSLGLLSNAAVAALLGGRDDFGSREP